jgi:hypothetical protein
MWMDAYVQQILIRQQIAETERTAAVRHLVRSAKARGVPGEPWMTIRPFLRRAAASWLRRPANGVAVR